MIVRREVTKSCSKYFGRAAPRTPHVAIRQFSSKKYSAHLSIYMFYSFTESAKPMKLIGLDALDVTESVPRFDKIGARL